MAVAEVKKIQLVGINKHRDNILNLLQNTAAVELIGETESEVVVQSLEYDIAQIAYAINFVSEHFDEKVPMIEKIRGGKYRLSKEEIEKIVEGFDYKSITTELTDIGTNLTAVNNLIEKNTEEIELLQPWLELTAAPSEFQDTKLTGILLGTISSTNFDELKVRLREIKDDVEITVVSKDEKDSRIMVVFSKTVISELTKLLEEHKFETISLPHQENLPKETIDRLTKEISATESERETIEKKISEYGKDIKNLKTVHDFLTWQLSQKSAERFVENTKRTFIMRFWVEVNNYEWLKTELEKVTKDIVFTELEIDDEEIIPVPLKNSALFTPFESITGIYGVPKSNEPDPTPLLAPFFVVYFGLALTDAAYGIILAVSAFLAIKVLKIPKQNQKLFVVLIWGGVSTFIAGALFGGWFGLDLDVLPVAMGDALKSVRILDPLAEPITVLILTMVLGIFQVMVGICIKGYWDIKHQNVKDAVLDSGTWLFFLGSIILWILSTASILPESLSKFFVYLIIAGTVLLVLTQGRDKKNPIMKIVMGILSLYGLVGYFSDVLSYSRLLALGLSTAIIASVVNLVAFLFKDMIPWAPIGWVVAIVILIGGHVFNMAINILGAYIHSGRLQFVEFFPKFMEGGGRRFRPFSKESKYILVITEEDD